MKPQKRKRKKRRDRLVLKLLIIVALVLVIFEGRLIFTMFTHRLSESGDVVTTSSNTTGSSGGTVSETETEKERKTARSITVSGSSTGDTTLAGLPGYTSAAVSSQPEQTTFPTVSNPGSPAIVKETTPPVDDSYFSDAVFIGDSRMEGFRNASGITQGRFFTSVGMSLSSMKSEPIISTSEGNITVAAALSGGYYNKIYIMLGTNDLGEYNWDSFREGFISVTHRFQEIQPGAIIYVCSVIYVDESKVASAQYVNNTNVDTINKILLEICEAEGYHYLDLNEFLSSGYGSLVNGASSDGVHLYPDYCKQMLTYLKNHYIEVPDASDEAETEKAETGEVDETEETEDS